MHFWIQLWLPQIWADISVNLSRVFFGQKTRDHHSLLWLHFGRGNAWQKDLSSRLYPAAWQNLNLKQIENFKGELWFCTYFFDCYFQLLSEIGTACRLQPRCLFIESKQFWMSKFPTNVKDSNNKNSLFNDTSCLIQYYWNCAIYDQRKF